MALVAEEIEKYERIKQLQRLGFNVPILMRIPCGTKFDKKLEKRLLDFASGRELMTVRTYAPAAEKLHGGAPFFPEIPVRKAISKLRELLPHFHVLFQEAVDWKKTRMVGRTLLVPSSTSSYEALRGNNIRVRDLDFPPAGRKPLVGFFASTDEIQDPEIRAISERISRIPVALREPGPLVVEWNLQASSDPVGVRSEPLLLWEWRPGA